MMNKTCAMSVEVNVSRERTRKECDHQRVTVKSHKIRSSFHGNLGLRKHMKLYETWNNPAKDNVYTTSLIGAAILIWC